MDVGLFIPGLEQKSGFRATECLCVRKFDIFESRLVCALFWLEVPWAVGQGHAEFHAFNPWISTFTHSVTVVGTLLQIENFPTDPRMELPVSSLHVSCHFGLIMTRVYSDSRGIQAFQCHHL